MNSQALNRFFRFSSFYLIFIFTIFTLHLNSILDLPQIKISKEKESLNFNDSILYLNGGLKRLVTSILWIKTLLDSDLERSSTFDASHSSWMFHRFMTMAKLDPKFILNFEFGGKYLSIIKDDLYGAEKLYLFGLKYHPHSYDLNFNLAFVYFSELNQPLLALPLLLKIKDYHEAPVFIHALIATLMMKGNVEKEQIILFLEKAKKETDLEHLILRYNKKLEALRKNK